MPDVNVKIVLARCLQISIQHRQCLLHISPSSQRTEIVFIVSQADSA